MKRLPNFKNLKRLNILNKPARAADITAKDTDEFEDRWLLEREKIEVKKIRSWRHQLAS